MKREILCFTCASTMRDRFPDPEPFPGEHVKFTPGKLLNDATCDRCAKPLRAHDSVTCMSFWIDARTPYYPWEQFYVATEGAEP